MSHLPSRLVLLCSFILVTGLASLTAAEPKTAAHSNGVVDIVALKSGRQLRGEIVWRDTDGTLAMAVSTDWLRKTDAAFASTALKLNIERRKSAWIQTRDRIIERLKTSVDSPQLSFFLKQEQERFDKLLSDPAPAEPEFVWFDIAPQTIAKVTKAKPDQQRVAIFAWDERLPQVESRDANSLTKALIERGVKLDGPLPDLTERLPARIQGTGEWSARMALVEYTMVKSIDFQGMGETLVRTGEGQQANLNEILPKLLKQQLGSFLKDLTNEAVPAVKLNDSEWLKPVIQEAEKANSSGFRVTRLQIDSATSRVSVESRFVARMEQGKWQTVWSVSMAEDGTKSRPEAEALIEQDPQMKSAVDTLKSLGLGDVKTLQQAIRVGAATMSAQKSADGAFGEFRERYIRQLDVPPLRYIDSDFVITK